MDGREGIFYQNGVALAVNNSVNLLPSDLATPNVYLGRSEFSADPYFNGRLSAFRLNSTPLPLAQIVAPQPVISQPTNQALFAGGSPLNFAATAADYSGAPLAPSGFSWTGQLFSNGVAFTVFGPLTGATNGSYLVPTNLSATTNLFYNLNLTVTDTNGNQQTVSAKVLPQNSLLTLQTVPPGLDLSLDGEGLLTTTSVVAVAGMSHLLAAPSPQIQAGTDCSFVLWSDGGAAAHLILVPATNSLFTASYLQPAIAVGGGPGSLNLTWPQWAGPMTLYAATNLAPPLIWSPVGITPALSNGVLQVTLPATEQNIFYRLQFP
jgi:hypothetical protein